MKDETQLSSHQGPLNLTNAASIRGRRPRAGLRLLRRWGKTVLVAMSITIILGAVLIADTIAMRRFFALSRTDPVAHRIFLWADEQSVMQRNYAVEPHTYRMTQNVPLLSIRGTQQHDINGFRNGSRNVSRSRPVGQVRVLASGGSTTYSHPFVKDPQQAWIMQIGQLLREHYQLGEDQLLAINAGMPGATTKENLI